MNAARSTSVVIGAALFGMVLVGCGSSVDEMIMNPTTKDELIGKLITDDVAKRDIMTKLAANNDSKKEMAETLLGDLSVKALALEKLMADVEHALNAKAVTLHSKVKYRWAGLNEKGEEIERWHQSQIVENRRAKLVRQASQLNLDIVKERLHRLQPGRGRCGKVAGDVVER